MHPLFLEVRRCASRHRPSSIIFASAAPKQHRPPPGILLLEGEHSLGREQFSISNVAITGIESSIGIRSSKSLSRRRSFSITAWRNYKGARNCSPGAYRSPRKSRNAPSRRDVRPSIKYRPGKWILKPYM